MAPDLNSLPPSRSPSGSNSPLQLRPAQTSPENTRGSSSPHSPLAATASMNAAGLSQDSRRSSRRRSSLMTNLNLNDPTAVPPSSDPQLPSTSSSASLSRSPIPMATADPHHHRTPSLGELHQELEAEQEAQVNRLLSMIRQQQAQLETLQRSSHSTAVPGGATAIEDSTPTSERSFSIPSVPPSQPHTASISNPRPASPRHRTSHEYRRPSLSRQSSRRSHASASGSRTGSPALPPLSRQHEGGSSGESSDFLLGGPGAAGRGADREGRDRDESAFYQAETQMLTRENQMLKQRIRELERQILEMNTGGSTPHSPARSSSLTAPPLEASAASDGATSNSTVRAEAETKED